PYDVIGTITIPTSIGGPEQRQLRGSLVGHLTYPSVGIIFEDVTMEVTVPVEILLLPRSAYQWASGLLRSRVLALADMALAAMLILLAALALMQALRARGRARERKP